jgi:Ca2+-binding RTX toxin-like protein
MSRRAVLVIASLIACLAALPAVAQAAKKTQVLYGSDGSGSGMNSPAPGPADLYELNQKSGIVKRKIGSTGYSVTGLALHPRTKVLYGVTGTQDQRAPGSLIKVNKATGNGKLIGDEIEGTDTGAADITFTNDGTLYGWSEETDDLVRINLKTGAATVVGPSGLSTEGSGISAAPNDTLFLAPEAANGDLFAIDRTDGSATSVTTMDGAGRNINALAFDRAGRLFGSMVGEDQPLRDLLSIDTVSGHVTTIGASVDRLDAIEFSEPNNRCKGAKANVLGTSKKDRLRGTKRDDLLAGGRGNDRLNGRGGDDCVSGEAGNDKLSGGGGKDKLKGGGGKDKVKAADGKRDKVNCGSGDDSATVDPEDRVHNCEEVDVT